MYSELWRNFEKIKDKKIIIVGVTGLVGQEMFKIFNDHSFPIENIEGCASSRSDGETISYGNGHIITVQDIGKVNFKKYDIALFSAGSEVSKKYVPKVLESGCTVIDNTSYFRMNEEVPLVVPEINIDTVKDSKLIANPNCSTIQMVLPLKPLHDLFGLKELVISTYQAAGGAGRRGVHALFEETRMTADDNTMYRDSNSPFKKQLAFNLIPQIGDFADLDYTQEEWKMINETKKILELPNIDVTATCVRVPVRNAHSISVFAKFENNVDINKTKEVLDNFDGVVVKDNPAQYEYATPLDLTNKYHDEVLVSRIRKHPTIDNGLSFWCVANNLRKGAALNAIQIASLLKY